MSYNPNQHPRGGTELGVSIDGKMYVHPANKAYMDSLKTHKSLDKIKSDTVSSAGFQKKRVTEDSKSEREAQRERLVLMQGEESRLSKQLEGTRKIINYIKQWLEEN